MKNTHYRFFFGQRKIQIENMKMKKVCCINGLPLFLVVMPAKQGRIPYILHPFSTPLFCYSLSLSLPSCSWTLTLAPPSSSSVPASPVTTSPATILILHIYTHLHSSVSLIVCSDYSFSFLFCCGRYFGGEGAGWERHRGPRDPGGFRPYRRQDPEGKLRRRLRRARRRLDRRRRRQRVQSCLGTRRRIRPPNLPLRLQQCTIQHLRSLVLIVSHFCAIFFSIVRRGAFSLCFSHCSVL